MTISQMSHRGYPSLDKVGIFRGAMKTWVRRVQASQRLVRPGCSHAIHAGHFQSVESEKFSPWRSRPAMLGL